MVPLRPSSRPLYFLKPLLKRVAKAALSCAHRTSTVSSCAFCEQEVHLAASFSRLSVFQLLLGGGLVDPQMRASNEHLLSVRVPRAGGRLGRPLSPPLLGNTLHPSDSVHSAPQWNRPDPTNAASIACRSPTRQCTV